MITKSSMCEWQAAQGCRHVVYRLMAPGEAAAADCIASILGGRLQAGGPSGEKCALDLYRMVYWRAALCVCMCVCVCVCVCVCACVCVCIASSPGPSPIIPMKPRGLVASMSSDPKDCATAARR